MKILIKSSLQNSEYEEENVKKFEGILSDNIIRYKEDSIDVEIILDEIVSLSRVSDEYEIRLTFIGETTTIGSYIIKDIDQQLELEVTTSKLKVKDGQILIDYELSINNEKFKFKLDYEVIS